jgi:TPR repeat protein
MSTRMSKTLFISFCMMVVLLTPVSGAGSQDLLDREESKKRPLSSPADNDERRTKRRKMEDRPGDSNISRGDASSSAILKESNPSSTNDEFLQREIIINKIYEELEIPDQYLVLALDKLFPNLENFSELSSKEMWVLLRVWNKRKTLVPSNFTEEIICRSQAQDPLAQFVLANMHEHGSGVPKTQAAAIEWYVKAARQGNAQAQYRIGWACFNYDRSEENRATTAVKWFTRAAGQGHLNAQNILGHMYQQGKKVEKDEVKAVEWLSKAAEGGHPCGQYSLGMMYLFSKMVKKDVNKAVEWFTKAAEQGYLNAQNILGYMYQRGEKVEKDEVKAVEWLSKAAEGGHARAQYSLGMMYLFSEMVKKDVNKAVEWFTKAAEQGEINAQHCLGCLYHKGDGIDQDEAKGIEWLRIAAKRGHSRAQNSVGIIYLYGKGKKKNGAKALEWFLKSSKGGNPRAQYNLGVVYWYGKGVDKDEKRAIEWYTKAGEQGNTDAHYMLGKIYYEGRSVEKDEIKGIKWFIKGAAQGHKNSQTYLKNIFKIDLLDREPPSSLNAQTNQQIIELRQKLEDLKALYLFHSAKAHTSSFEDSLGKNLYLSQFCADISSSLEDYITVLESIYIPGFLISSIVPRQENLLHLCQYIGDNSQPFVCWEKHESLEQIQKSQLQKNIQQLNQRNSTALELLNLYSEESRKLEVLLKTAKILNGDVFNYLSPFFKSYTSSNGDITINIEQFKRVKDYLGELSDFLINHTEYTEDLNRVIFQLLLETTDYRNHLFKETYPWFFE